MSFPRSKRFQPEKSSGVPGPGTYNPKLLESEAYTNGMVAKSDRFKEQKVEPEIPLASSSKANILSNPSAAVDKKRSASGKTPADVQATLARREAEDLQMKLEKLKAHHDQFETKHAEQLLREESRAKDAIREKSLADSQLEVLKKELRVVKNQEAVLKSELEKSEATRKSLSSKTSSRDSLEAQLQQLKEIHKESKIERNNTIKRLESELSAAKAVPSSSLSLKEQTIKDLTTSSAAAEKENTSLRSKVQELFRANAELQKKSDELKSQRDIAREESRTMREKDASSSSRLKARLSTLEETAARLQWEVEAKDEMIEEITEAYGVLFDSSIPTPAFDAVMSALSETRVEVQGLQSQLQQKSERCLSLEEMMHDSTRRVAMLESLWEDETHACASLLGEREAIAAIDAGMMAAPLLSALDFDIESATSTHVQESPLRLCLALSDTLASYFSSEHSNHQVAARTIASSLIAECKESSTIHKLTLSNSELSSRSSTLATELDALNATLAPMERELVLLRARRDTFESEMAERKQFFETEMKNIDNRIQDEREKSGRVASALSLKVQAISALEADLLRTQEELENAREYQSDCFNLMKENDKLRGLQELAQDEAQHLAEFNAQILSHGNENQKVFYVDKIRNELMHAKQALVQANVERKLITEENGKLKDELYAYRNVGVPATLKHRVSRPALGLSKSVSSNTVPASGGLLNQSIGSAWAKARGRENSLDGGQAQRLKKSLSIEDLR